MKIQKYDQLSDHFLQQIHNWSKMGCFVKLEIFGASKLAWIQIFHPLNIRSMLPVLRNVYISGYNRSMNQNVYSSPNGCYIYLTISQTRQVLCLTRKASGSVKLTTIRPAKRSLFRDFPKLPFSFMLQFDR